MIPTATASRERDRDRHDDIHPDFDRKLCRYPPGDSGQRRQGEVDLAHKEQTDEGEGDRCEDGDLTGEIRQVPAAEEE